MITKHTKPSAANQAGGIIHQEGPIHVSNVMLMVDGKATRVGFEVKDGKKVRVAKIKNKKPTRRFFYFAKIKTFGIKTKGKMKLYVNKHFILPF